MSIDTKYLIQYEGPFGKEEWDTQLKELNSLPNSFGFQEFGYETIIGEVKNSADKEIVEITKKSSVVHVLKSHGGGYWEEIFKFKNE